jgi:hypothetical protein
MFSEKICRWNQNTHFTFSKSLFAFKSCRLWDNVVKYGTAGQATDDNIIRRMRFECRVTKATDTHTIRISANSCFSTGKVIARTRFIVTLHYIVSVVTFFIRRGCNSVRDLSTQIGWVAAGFLKTAVWKPQFTNGQVKKLKLKFILEQATKAHRGSRGVALLFL